MSVNILSFDEFEQAAKAVAGDASAKYFGGGTLLMREVNEGTATFNTLVTCNDSATGEVVSEGDRMFIGASVTMSQILADDNLRFLHKAAASVGAPAIRNMATVGGNLFAKSPYGDLGVALLALDGEAVCVESTGTRSVALQDFYVARENNQTQLVAGVSIVKPRDPSDFRFSKAQRVKPRGSSVVTIAAHLDRSGGRVRGAKVAYGAMAKTPIRATAVEQALENSSLDESGIKSALAVALEGTDPPTDAIASNWYRREVAPVYLKRLLLE